MSRVFEANLAALGERDPSLALRIRNLNANPELDSFSLKESNGIQLLQNARLIDSTEAGFLNALPRAKHSRKYQHVFVLGFGMGTLLAQLLEARLTFNRKILVVEPSLERFSVALQITHFEKIFKDERIHWLIGLDSDQIFNRLLQVFRSTPNSLSMDAFEYLEHPVISVENHRYFVDFKSEWDAVRLYIREIYGSFEDALTGFKNVVQNTDQMNRTPGVSVLRGAIKDRPAIVCSAGPSLVLSLEVIKKTKVSAFIVAVDAAAAVCLEHGVEPHLICSLERSEVGMDFFRSLQKHVGKMRSELVFYPMVPASILSAFEGPQWVALRDYTYFRFIDQKLNKGVLASGASVAHFATRLCEWMGASSIALVGQDLCFDSDTWSSHAVGVSASVRFEHASKEELEARLLQEDLGALLELPGNLEEKVYTHALWYRFMKEFTFLSSQMPGKIINATPGGLSIPNIAWLRLEKWLEDQSIEPVDYFSILDAKRKEASLNAWEWKEVAQFVSQISDRLLAMAEASRIEQVAEASRRATLALLYQSKKGLEENAMFSAFVLELTARDYLESENVFASIAHPSEELEFSYLKNWFLCMAQSARRVAQVLRTSL